MMKKFCTFFIIYSKAVVEGSPWTIQHLTLWTRNFGLRSEKLRGLSKKEHVKHNRLQPYGIPFGRLAPKFMKNALRSSEIRSKSLLPHHPWITGSTYAEWNVSSSWASGVHGSVLKSSAHPSQGCEVKAIFVQTRSHPTSFVLPARDVFVLLG